MDNRSKAEVIKEDYWTIVANSKFMKIFSTLDQLISRNLLSAGIETRPVKSNGLWCCVLLPAVLCIYTALYDVSLLYKIAASVSIGLFFYSILFVLFLSVSCVVVKEPVYGGCTASGMVSVLILYIFLEQDFFYSVLFSLPTLFLYNVLLKTCLVTHPKTFTVGEAMIVSQGISLFCITMAIKMFYDVGEYDEEMEFVYTIANTVLTTVALMVTALYLLSDEHRNLANLSKILILGVTFCLLVLHSIIGVGFLPKICQYIFFSKNRIQIFSFWLALVVIAVLVLLSRTQLAVKANTVTRKSFHILASLVYMSGILLDVNLIVLASGLAVAALILTEALRKARIEPISSALQSAFDVYSDDKVVLSTLCYVLRRSLGKYALEYPIPGHNIYMHAKFQPDPPSGLGCVLIDHYDVGSFAMTPLYLLAGLAAPLALVPAHGGAPLERLAGVLAVGVGDTAASWAGSNYGFYKWKPDNSKTLEGTAFNILSQITTVYGLLLFELLSANNALLRAGGAALASGLAEAHTAQVDNLVLPLVSLLAFQATFMLC